MGTFPILPPWFFWLSECTLRWTFGPSKPKFCLQNSIVWGFTTKTCLQQQLQFILLRISLDLKFLIPLRINNHLVYQVVLQRFVVWTPEMSSIAVCSICNLKNKNNCCCICSIANLFLITGGAATSHENILSWQQPHWHHQLQT